ncbi:hypothetical protein LguiA_033130 [Lonicera macranthoides]
MMWSKDEREWKMDLEDENFDLSTQEVDWDTKFQEGNRGSSRKYSNKEYNSKDLEEQMESSKDETKVKEHIIMMQKMLSQYEDFDPKPIGFCIYKVPEKLRVLNEDAYTPRVVSIGPIHHDREHLQAMEPYKWRCLKRYLERSLLKLDAIAQITMESEVRARAHYKDNFEKFSKFDFSKMMMLDCVFVIEHFLECVLGTEWLSKTTCDSTIFGDQLLDRDILHDLMLLENQVPYSVLSELYEKGTPPSLNYPTTISLNEVMHTYFKDVEFSDTHFKNNEESNPINNRNKHLLDFLRESNSLVLRKPLVQNEQESRKEVHKGNRRGKLERTRTATELQEAGVNFKNKERSKGPEEVSREDSVSCSNCRETRNCSCDIIFNSQGVLTIPQLKINDCTEIFFRNLIAFEQCRRPEFDDMSVTSYVILMDSLIKTPKDVALLINYGIIESSLGDNDQVQILFSNLRKEIVMDNKDFSFAPLCEGLNMYSKDRLHQWKGSLLSWKRMLRRDYFSNPWSAISVVAAIILLLLTIIQTICSILQV